MTNNWQASWSVDGTLGKSQKSEPTTESDARAICKRERLRNRSVTLLKEGEGINAGKFFLHAIIK